MTPIPRPLLALALTFAFAAAAPLRAAPPAKPAPPGAAAAPAVAALLKEYQAVMTEKKGEGLREKCDFVDNAGGALSAEQVAALTPEVVLAAIERPVAGADARAEAYVKWQLLSAVKGKFPDELKARAIAAYRRAPQPTSHPGIDRTALDRVLNRVGVTKSEAEPGINKEFGDAIVRYRVQTEPMLSYRDELYARLPAGLESLAAGLEDVAVRVGRGAPANEFWTTVSSGIRSWSLTADDPRQPRQVAAAVAKLKGAVVDEKNRPYHRVVWDGEKVSLKWVAENTIQNVASMDELVTFLNTQAENPGGGLKFKEPGEKK